MLASVATNGARSKVAPAALSELKNACDLFEAASPYGGRAIKFLVSLIRSKTWIKPDMQLLQTKKSLFSNAYK